MQQDRPGFAAGIGERDRIMPVSPLPHSQQQHSRVRAARMHRYPGIKPDPPPVPRRHPMHAPGTCPFAVPELHQKAVDHAGQRRRIRQYAEQRSAARNGATEQSARRAHQAALDSHRSATRPVAAKHKPEAVIRREAERVRAAKGLPPPRRLCNRIASC
eukprot:jgi/Ulvmu1/2603/UM014_0054.1